MTPAAPPDPALNFIFAHPWLLTLLADPIGPIIEWTCWMIVGASVVWAIVTLCRSNRRTRARQ